jgi:chromosome segregation protein
VAVFLKSVELYGFKSFADRTKFEFSDGITSLLGPNGSGKSNVVDSIKWVLGTQAPSAIRAGKREDVIFNGTDYRKPMPMCEVILTLNNEENFLNIDATEVEIKRRMFRNGDNEYYINRQRALLRDVKELFLDTGVGKSSYSIMEQGKIDQILSLKPEDRRYIFEEASGISRFKQQSDEAAKKLQKTDDNMAQVELLLREAEKVYNSRKIQLDKVLKHRELSARKEALEVDLQLSYVQSLTKLKNFREAEQKKLEEEAAQIDALMDSVREGLDKQQTELEDLRRQREGLYEGLHRNEERINSFDAQIKIFNDRYSEVSQRSKEAQLKAQQYKERIEKDNLRLDEKLATLDSLVENIHLTEASIEKATEEIEIQKTNRIKHQLDIDDLNKLIESLSEKRVEITQQISDLANDIANRLEENIKGSGYSSVVRAKAEKSLFEELNKAKKILGERIEFLRNIASVDFDSKVFMQALDDADESLLTELDEIKGLFQEYSGTIPTFLDEFVAPQGTLAKKASLDASLEQSYQKETESRARIADLSAEIERLNRMLILKESDLRDLRDDEIQFKAQAKSMKDSIAELRQSLQQMEFDFSDASHSLEAEQDKVNEVLERIDDVKNRKLEAQADIKQIKESIEQLSVTIEEKASQISSENTQFQEKFNRRQALIGEIAAAVENVRSLGVQIQERYTTFFDNTGKSLKEFNNHEITAPVDQLKSELETVKKRIQDLGYINYMAEDEYNEAKKNFDFYSKNMEDLNKAKTDLEEVIAEIKRQSEELFMQTYKQIADNFQEMYTTLFGGGRAELRLTDSDNVLESGIDIFAQPPGKKLLNMQLLSGGERSMTAVALLFATYMVKPSPFCILDEIDAALDARNIGAFLRVLEKFDDKSQFIIITHNKNTVLGSNSLLGVTQQELGVSKMIGYRLEDIKDIDKTYDELKG